MEPLKTNTRHVVLVHPDVHWNTGNIGRTCLGTGTTLHLIKPLGFSIDDKHLKRAGLDYWDRVDCHVWESWDEFMGAMTPEAGDVALFTKNGKTVYWDMPRPERLFLIFGSETKGLPEAVLKVFPEQTFHIPTNCEIRSLNLSTAAGIALFESLRGTPVSHDWVEA